MIVGKEGWPHLNEMSDLLIVCQKVIFSECSLWYSEEQGLGPSQECLIETHIEELKTICVNICCNDEVRTLAKLSRDIIV